MSRRGSSARRIAVPTCGMARESSTIDTATRRAYDPAHLRQHARQKPALIEEATMQRRIFLKTATLGAATLAFPSLLRAQGKEPIRIGFPLPLTGPFAAIAGDMKQGAELAVDELNAKNGILGRKVELLIRDDQLKPQVGAQRTQELIEKEHCQFIVGGLAAHVQMAINEQTKKAKVLFISTSQSDEITAKPDASTITFHEALNPTITSRVVGKWVMENLGKKWWIVYADYAWGKQNNAVLIETNKKMGGTVLGSTPYPLGSAEFSAHLPKIQAAKPEVLMAVTPGADDIAFLKQVKSFGMHQQMKLAKPLHWISVAKQGGPELYQDVYGGVNFYWELQDSIPEAKRYVEGFNKKFGIPPGDYGVYAYSAVLEVARGSELAKTTDADKVAEALRKSPQYNHVKGKQWWRACDNKSIQDMWILKGRAPGKTKGDWGLLEIVSRVPANEDYDRTCAEKGHTG
ncbi:MAG: ABC transporter substrate-binding protein [Candidatus Rokuibacteriota bacterium]|nr:MAG: ABC transporter substrate-binding protein [Candidatus Rokubacteria bacterium]